MATTIRATLPALYRENGLDADEAFADGVGDYNGQFASLAPLFRIYEQGDLGQTDQYTFAQVNRAGSWQKVPETQAAATTAPSPGYNKTLRPSTYEDAIAISDEAISDAKFPEIYDDLRSAGFKFRLQQEKDLAAVLNDAAAGATYTGGDGLSLLHDAHTVPDGAFTQDNRGASTLGTAGAIAAALAAMLQWKDNAGSPAPVMPAYLVVPPALQDTAVKLIYSDYSPQTVLTNEQMNAINALRRYSSLDVLSSPLIGAAFGGSDSRWFLIARGGLVRGGLMSWRRQQLSFEAIRAAGRVTTLYARYRQDVGFLDWRGVYGYPT